uniref:Uncharacterized protein n=2 Tax=Gasterosteus aculeatus aculeatus TaxID=481459 RepID=A0AAQ4QLD4_GASAC
MAWKKVECPFEKDRKILQYLLTAPVFTEDALYLASYESEGPENHMEKDRWKSLRCVITHTHTHTHTPSGLWTLSVTPVSSHPPLTRQSRRAAGHTDADLQAVHHAHTHTHTHTLTHSSLFLVTPSLTETRVKDISHLHPPLSHGTVVCLRRMRENLLCGGNPGGADGGRWGPMGADGGVI